MSARVITGSKREIAEKVAQLDGDVREAIVFIEEPGEKTLPTEDIFAEMDQFTVRQSAVDDSREAIYQPQEGE
jgi:hypothetical protein